MWDTAAVEWYYPGLTAGATHAVVNRSTAVGVVEQLLSDPDLVAALSRAAKKVQADLLCEEQRGNRQAIEQTSRRCVEVDAMISAQARAASPIISPTSRI